MKYQYYLDKHQGPLSTNPNQTPAILRCHDGRWWWYIKTGWHGMPSHLFEVTRKGYLIPISEKEVAERIFADAL
jgi:hypothetical protein